MPLTPPNASEPGPSSATDADGPTGRIPLRFGWSEASGSLGDLGTFLPIAVALSATCGLNFAAVLLFAGLMNLATGWWFRQPLAVQPMKAIAALAIADQLSASSVLAAGVLMGVLMLALGWSGLAERLGRWVPAAAIRGIQLGIGLKLSISATAQASPQLTAATLLLAAALASALLWPRTRRLPLLLLVVAVGLIVAIGRAGLRLDPGLPLDWFNADAEAWKVAALQLLPAQAPLTLLNSLLAVCLLSADLYPGRGIPPRPMAVGVGLMNLVACPLGGMPMCHGAGGLAAQHAFGARTGGSVILLGGAKVTAALLLGAAAAPLLAAFPGWLLGSLLIIAGLRLAVEARRCRGRDAVLAAAVAAAVLAGWTLLAVAVVALGLALRRIIGPADHTKPVTPADDAR